jgi:hypothetical protein
VVTIHADAEYQSASKGDTLRGCISLQLPNACKFVQIDIGPSGWCEPFGAKISQIGRDSPVHLRKFTEFNLLSGSLNTPTTNALCQRGGVTSMKILSLDGNAAGSS